MILFFTIHDHFDTTTSTVGAMFGMLAVPSLSAILFGSVLAVLEIARKCGRAIDTDTKHLLLWNKV